jgi:hypothetical protein
MNKFSWGEVIDHFALRFDDEVLYITKYYDKHNNNEVAYHCEEIHRSSNNMYAIVLYWITHKQLGLNQSALTEGIIRALEIK